ncbi:transcription factor MYB3 [Amborella trichopoda]|uniref:Uncharacterized protein n=1 Tax=Amborella trichopoda TaxID=13333 RepID=U5DDW1_AMBTC|nr:transcription factor MYB3 [Amborella trichopoda]ERN20415.1 hypothetical protein AMTR_s00068p00099460 [Amborella trichopoda]|eukprot:XP_006858948.1 transcription factor MYB3 [Amborella trichopoda]
MRPSSSVAAATASGRSGSRGNGGMTPCCSKVGMKRGPWTPEEDEVLVAYIAREGEGRWRTLPKRAGLLRCGKSCRLRWMNYLRPCVKRGHIAPDEEDLILRLHRLLGNRWSLIAGRIPGRTDNEVKNFWNTHLSKKLISQGINPRTHKPLLPSSPPGPLQNPNNNMKNVIPPVVRSPQISQNPKPPHASTHFSAPLSPHPPENPNPDGNCEGFLEESGSGSEVGFQYSYDDEFDHEVTTMATENVFEMGNPNSDGGGDNEYNSEDTFSSFLDSLISGDDDFLLQEQQQLMVAPEMTMNASEPQCSYWDRTLLPTPLISDHEGPSTDK